MKYGIGAKIRRYRELRGFSQKEFAAKIGVSNSRVSNWEQGINRPDADILATICHVLDVSADRLLDIAPSNDQGNTVRLAGRDGSCAEKTLSDEQFAALKLLIDQLPEGDDR